MLRSDTTARIAWTILVAAAAAVLFLPAVNGSHLNLDDWGFTYGCPFVKDGLSFSNIAKAFASFGYGGIWMPLTSITYMADISLWGRGWMPHHAVNVFLHAVNAALVFNLVAMIVKRFMADKSCPILLSSAIATLFWTCNPERVEAVAWIASRKEELWTLFSLLSLAAWIRRAETGSRTMYFASLGLFILACLSKPTALCLPILALTLEKALPGGGKIRPARYLPFFAVSILTGIAAFATQIHPEGMAQVELYGYPLWWRMLNAAVSSGIYIFHTAVPYGVYTDWRAIPCGWPLWSAVGLPALAIASAIFMAALKFSKDGNLKRILVLCSVWFASSLAPVLGIAGFTGDKALAPRYSYFPAIAFSVAAAFALCAARRKAARAALGCAMLSAAACSAAASTPVLRSFAHDVSLAHRALAFDKDNWRALRTAGRDAATRLGLMDDGIEMVRRSLRIRESQTTMDILLYLLACRGTDADFAEVKRVAGSVAKNPEIDRSGMILDALGTVAMREGNPKSACRFFAASLAAPARSYTREFTLLNFALSLANDGRREDAAAVLGKLSATSSDAIRARAEVALGQIRSGGGRNFEWMP